MYSHVHRAAAVAVLLVFASVAAGAGSADVSPREVATVERIVDGDTLVVRGGARVRLVQIDTPESRGECYAAASTRELARLARPGTRVVLEADPGLDRVDRYGRLLRYVQVGRVNVNVELVRLGAATPWFYGGKRGRYASQLLVATASARAARRGLWGSCRVYWSPTEPIETRPK